MPVSGAWPRTRGRVPSVTSAEVNVARRIRASVTGGPTSVESGTVTAVERAALGGPGRDDRAVRVAQPEPAQAGDEVLRHPRDEHLDDPLAAATVAARALIGLDAVDEGTGQQLFDGDADRLGSLDANLSATEDRAADDVWLGVAGPDAQQVVGERVLGPRVRVGIEHGPRIAEAIGPRVAPRRAPALG